MLITLSDAEYHARKELSNSKLSAFLASRRDYHREHILGLPRGRKDCFAFGGLLHAMLLDPADLDGRYRVMPTRADRGQEDGGKPDARMYLRSAADKAYFAEWEAECEAAGIEMVRPEDAALALPMVEALAKHEQLAEYLRHPKAMREQTILWTHEDTGRAMRSKLDLVIPSLRVVVDLKSAAKKPGRLSVDAMNDANRRDWTGYGYHRQAACYLQAAYEAFGENFAYVLGFIEKSEDPTVSAVQLDVDSLSVIHGAEEVTDGIRALQACEESDDWREPCEVGVQRHEILPAWKINQLAFESGQGAVEGATEVDGDGR